MIPYISHAQKNTAPTYTAEWTNGLLWYASMKRSAIVGNYTPASPKASTFYAISCRRAS